MKKLKTNMKKYYKKVEIPHLYFTLYFADLKQLNMK